MSSSAGAGALGKWAFGFKLEDAPQVVRNETAKALLNSIATAIGGSEIDHTKRALAFAREGAQTGLAHAFVSGDKLPPALAGFVNGVMVNALGQEETHTLSGTHPAETTVPIALAEAEAVGASGRELVEALIVGMQVSGAVGGMSLVWRGRELLAQPPSAYGTIGAAAAAAKLRGLDAEQTGRAIGLAAMFTAAPAESMRAGTGEYHYLKGMVAMHAHTASMLAAEGAQVSPDALEGPAGFYRIWGNIPYEELQGVDIPAELVAFASSHWVAPELDFKRYPVNYFNQPFIDCARALKDEHGITPGEVKSIQLRLGAHPAKVGGLGAAPFERRSSAMMSTRFAVACMLARGQVTLSDTLEPGGDDIRALADLCDIEVDEGDDAALGLSIVTDRGTFGGKRIEGFDDYRLKVGEIENIADEIVSNKLGQDASKRLISLCARVEELPSIAELVSATFAD